MHKVGLAVKFENAGKDKQYHESNLTSRGHEVVLHGDGQTVIFGELVHVSIARMST